MVHESVLHAKQSWMHHEDDTTSDRSSIFNLVMPSGLSTGQFFELITPLETICECWNACTCFTDQLKDRDMMDFPGRFGLKGYPTARNNNQTPD